MKRALRWTGQGLAYALFAAVLGYFSTSPAYVQLPADAALIKLSFTHAAQRKLPCHERSAEELARLPRNMRTGKDCPRERSNVVLEMEMDGVPLYHLELAPSGLAHDGASSVYRRLPVRAGSHHLVLRLKDREGGEFGYTADRTIELAAGRVLVIDFKADAPGVGGFVFHGGTSP